LRNGDCIIITDVMVIAQLIIKFIFSAVVTAAPYFL